MAKKLVVALAGLFLLGVLFAFSNSISQAQGKSKPGQATESGKTEGAATPTDPQSCDELSNYQAIRTTGAIEPGTTLVPYSRCDDCTVLLDLPFTFRLYDRVFTQAIAGDNGTLGFLGNPNDINNSCLPKYGHQYEIFAHWQDLDMSPATCPSCGIFTSVSGTSPSRIFNIEWRACGYSYGCSRGAVNFEIKLHEVGDGFDIVYGTVTDGGSHATIGVQRESSVNTQYTQVGCNLGGFANGLTLLFRQPDCRNTATPTATPPPPRCPGSIFTDVCSGDYFYTPVRNLVSRGVVSGYNSSPPCTASPDVPCFKPYSSITRQQAAKVVALAAGFTGSSSGQFYQDVDEGSPFYSYVMQLSNREVLAGYLCGGPGEPCVAPQNRPYFRPGVSVSRGQMSKIIAGAAGYADDPGGQSFADVTPGSTFYLWIQRLSHRGLITGYSCGGVGEPCSAGNLSYFRPSKEITRGQSAKIVFGVWPQMQMQAQPQK